ncbi:MAG: DegT/DnrJ/EryC1/StrS family aminotransferase [Paramuribaculum sp.]|nr:DegT/DnrJ/EryC1/StrS family aminotransferase [Paramuribaculum sp.]
MSDSKRIFLCIAHAGGTEELYIRDAFRTNWITSLGPNVDAFQDRIDEFINRREDRPRYSVALASGTAAVHLGLVLLGVQPGDEVICQSWTFAASTNPVVYLGAKPVFVDSEPLTLNMSPELLEMAIKDRLSITGKKPKAIIVVDLYGMPAQWDEIDSIARRYDIPVLEDSAEAMGSAYKGKQCGTFGKFGVFSFNGNKIITTGAGGALICPDEQAKKQAIYFATQARTDNPWYEHEHIGYNYRLSNVSAGIGLGQMEIIGNHIEVHHRLNSLYARWLGDLDNVRVVRNPSPDYDSNYWLTTVIFESPLPIDTSNKVRLCLESENIESRPLWKPMHLQPVYRNEVSYLNGVSGDLWIRGLCLPSGPLVSESDVERISRLIRNCVETI